MTLHLTKFQRHLCNILQNPIPICPQPFAQIAADLDTDQDIILSELKKLKHSGHLRRLAASINLRSLGTASTLVTAHIEPDILGKITSAVNSLPGVSHNYLRTHYYNLWFTLQARSHAEIDAIVKGLALRFDTDFYSLPATKIFKLDVRFDTDPCADPFVKENFQHDGEDKLVSLTDTEKHLLTKLQNELPIARQPFESLSDENLSHSQLLETIQLLIDKRVIRRVSAVLNHYKLGYVANVMFAAQIPHERIESIACDLARYKMVTHCYERQAFNQLPCNLFAMMHARRPDHISTLINEFTGFHKINSFELLPTAEELKKERSAIIL